jgi:hypothetical protein
MEDSATGGPNHQGWLRAPFAGWPSPRRSLPLSVERAIRLASSLGCSSDVRTTGHSFEKLFSQLSPAEQKAEAERLIADAKEPIAAQRLIDAEEGYVEKIEDDVILPGALSPAAHCKLTARSHRQDRKP